MVAGKSSEIIVTAKPFSYVLEHDKRHAPNPYIRICTFCRCECRASRKANRTVGELAKPGDWAIGNGGLNGKRSAGRGKLVYRLARLPSYKLDDAALSYRSFPVIHDLQILDQ
jgi:hypothetical protein